MHATGAGILADGGSNPRRQIWIPRRSQANAAEDRRWTIVAYADGAIRHFQAWQPDLLTGANVEIVHTTDQVDLLVESQLLKKGIDAEVHIRGGCLRLGTCQKNGGNQEKKNRPKPSRH
jgi:hypothetical protein